MMGPEQMQDLAERSLNEIDSDFRVCPGYRAAQAKGTVCRGTFTAGADAEKLTTAVHFQSGVVTPVTARFSNFTANPIRPDGLLDVRGMATAFHLPDGGQADITALRMPRFFVGTATHFVRWQRGTMRNPWGDLPLPKPLMAFHLLWGLLPFMVPVRQIRPLCKVPTYAATRYNSLHAYAWVDENGDATYVRYSWVPEIRQERYRAWQWRWWAASWRDPDYLRRDLLERLARWPVRFRLEVQLKDLKDRAHDASAKWKSERRVVVGMLDLTAPGSWDSTGLAPLEFQPTRVTEGIELPKHDSLLMLRKHVYQMSARRRSAYQGPERSTDAEPKPDIPPDASLPEPPFLDPDRKKCVRNCADGHAGRIELCYQTSGEKQGRPLLLIMGFACAMTWWHRDFCRMLEDRGFDLIRFDNRDSGRSSRGGSKVSKLRLFWPKVRGRYTIDDMADDAAELVQRLDAGPVHVMGISLGGMVAQALAIRHPHSVRSLTSINSAPKIRRWPPSQWPKWSVTRRLFWPQPKRSEERWVKWSVRLWRRLNGSGYVFDRKHVENLLHVAWAWSGGVDPNADLRQLLAVLASPDRTKGLQGLEIPALVVQGTDDGLVRPVGGRKTHEAIPGARWMQIEGMGHYTPIATWEQIVDGIDEIAREAEGRRREPAGAVPAGRPDS